MTAVWLFEPRSHGRRRKSARARNGAPLPGRHPSSRIPHRPASPALCPWGHAAAIFSSSCVVVVLRAWCLVPGVRRLNKIPATPPSLLPRVVVAVLCALCRLLCCLLLLYDCGLGRN